MRRTRWHRSTGRRSDRPPELLYPNGKAGARFFVNCAIALSPLPCHTAGRAGERGVLLVRSEIPGTDERILQLVGTFHHIARIRITPEVAPVGIDPCEGDWALQGGGGLAAGTAAIGRRHQDVRVPNRRH